MSKVTERKVLAALQSFRHASSHSINLIAKRADLSLEATERALLELEERRVVKLVRPGRASRWCLG